MYKLDGVSEDRNVNVYKPLEGEERVMLKCPMAKRMSPSEEVALLFSLSCKNVFTGDRTLVLGRVKYGRALYQLEYG